MKIIRFQDSAGTIYYGSQQPDGSALLIDGDIYGTYAVTTTKADVAKLLAPIMPTAIMCIGLNYRLHAAESGAKIPEFPVLFMKTLGAVQNPGDPIELPTHLKSNEVDYECELAVVIGKAAKNVSKERALDYVLGYTCANDVSARDWQRTFGGSQWCRGKTFDTFCP
ncbi:MAG: 5-carboxymethyl-2-hydroxymuconate isomerase, partial [Verrucomicrobiaceae bacterium]|nr:5-carboxymethyl-2-hydroxymuconate isomerase [Verrucomicrobiaceae bacterium]